MEVLDVYTSCKTQRKSVFERLDLSSNWSVQILVIPSHADTLTCKLKDFTRLYFYLFMDCIIGINKKKQTSKHRALGHTIFRFYITELHVNLSYNVVNE
jgi:hypothetical protein